MPYPAETVRVLFGGSLPGGEVWQCGFGLRGEPVTSQGQANELADLLWSTFCSNDDSGAMRESIQQLTGPTTNVTKVSAYCYPGGGSAASYIGQHVDTAIVGTGTVSDMNQKCAVLTLRSDTAGRSHRGRMYLPATHGTTTANGQIDPSVQALVVNAWATGFSDWNAATDGTCCVISLKLGQAVDISTVTMDSRYDVQRRRANKQSITTSLSAPVTLPS